MKIGTIISVHNRLNYTKRCLHCLNQASKKHLLDLIIIDDGSTDNSNQWIKNNYPDAHLVKGNGDLWFGRSTQIGINIALSKNKYDYILIINNDTFLLEGSLDIMVEKARKVNVVGSLYEVEDLNQIRSCGFNWEIFKGLKDITLDKRWKGKSCNDNFIEVYSISTTATLFPINYLLDSSKIRIELHPHHRYDALLSSICRNHGAKFFVPKQILAHHIFGHRTTNKSTNTFSRFINDLFFDPLNVHYIPGIFNYAFAVAPNPVFAFIYIFKMNLYFLYKLLKGILNKEILIR